MIDSAVADRDRVTAVTDNTVPDRDRITVVILTHNRREELSRSLAHLQTLPEHARIIVIDNGSTDDTAQYIKSGFPEMDLVRTEHNLGAAGRNLGVQQVRTPYVAFSDDDTWWTPGSLHRAAKLLDEHPRIAVLNARILVGPEEHPDPACIAMASSPLPRISGVGPLLTGFMAGACVMRTDIFLRAGGYWPGFFIGGEEALLAMDILDAGHHIVYAPALTVHHWPSKMRDSTLRRRLIARNGIWTAWLRLPWRLAWRRTCDVVRHIPDHHLRWRVLMGAMAGVRPVLARRHVLRSDTCELLEHVWSHETR